MRAIKKIKQFIGFGNSALSLENKLFNLVCLFLGFSMIVGFVSNMLLGFPVALMMVELFICGMCVFAFYRSRFVKYSENMALSYVTVGVLLLIPGWFFNGGVEGSTTHVGIFMIVLITILLKRKYHFYFIGFLIAVFITCYLLEKHFPQWVTQSQDKAQKESDLIFSTLSNIFMVGMLVSFLKRSHEKDKLSLTRKTDELLLSQIELSAAKDKAEEATLANNLKGSLNFA